MIQVSIGLPPLMLKFLRAFYEFVVHLYGRVKEDRLLQVSGSLTFTTLLALVPLLTVALTVFSAFPVFSAFSEAIQSFVVDNLVPDASAKVVTVYMQQFAENAGKLTAAGLAILGMAAVMTMFTIDRTFNVVWRVPRPRPVVSRLVIYWGALTIGPLLIGASLSLTSWLLSLSMGLARVPSETTVTLLRLVPLLLTSLAFAFLYRTVPNRPVQVHDAITGGLIAGLLFEGMKTAFSAYIANVPTYKLVYGAFASFPIFLLWVYLSWLIILVGAELTAALPYLRQGGVRRRTLPGSDFLDAMQLLKLLHDAHQQGRVPTTQHLRNATHLPIEACEALLERLTALGWAARATNDSWVLARDAREIRLAAVHRAFVFRTDRLKDAESGLDRRLVGLIAKLQEDLAISLAELFEPAEPERPRPIPQRNRHTQAA